MKLKGIRKAIAVVLSMSFGLSMMTIGVPNNKAKAADYGLNNPRIDSEGNVTWDCAYFGSYNQTAQWIKEPIKWRVLSVDEDNNAFIVADKNLDCKPYNETDKAVTWETSTIRSWLNGYGADYNGDGVDYSTDNFIDEAFTEEEQAAINTTTVINNDNPSYGTDGGNDTEDKVYLLSIEEASNAEYGFYSTFDKYNETREAKTTEFAKLNGAYTEHYGEHFGDGVWWLRSPGDLSNVASYVWYNGSGDDDSRDGWHVDYYENGVRPALQINLSSLDVWSVAGVTDSNGNDSLSDSIINNPVIKNGVTIWDCIYFGSYNQILQWTKEPIKWRVLSVDEDYNAFIVSDKNLDSKSYGESTWEKSTMRSWLNGYGAAYNSKGVDYSTDNFIDVAFTEEEQSAINTTTVINNDNPSNGKDGGNDTEDKVYLLSVEEASNSEYGFDNTFDESLTRDAKNTDYVMFKATHNVDNYDYPRDNSWWLRSTGSMFGSASVVRSSRWISTEGEALWNSGVRPALQINLSSSSVWSVAGTTDSEGNDGISDNIINNPVVEDGVTTWDCIYFGNYYQSSVAWNKEPIKWRVLSVDGDDALFVADRSLDCKQYNETNEAVTWETSTIRSWLNGYGTTSNSDGIDYSSDNFIDKAFNEDEQSAIKTVTVINNDNPKYGTDGGNDTEDKVYLLSVEDSSNEAYGFNCIFDECYSKSREAKNTDYVKYNGAYKREGEVYWDSAWWLRSPGDESDIACIIGGNGWGDLFGEGVSYGNYGVRPALHINLSSSVWEPAGTVTSVITGYVEEEDFTPTDKPEETITPVATQQPVTQPIQAPVVTQIPAPMVTQVPVQTVTPTEAPKADKKVKAIKLSSLGIKKNTTKITGKLSVSKATVKIKVGSKAWKKASVKGKKFTLKTTKLKKKTKVQIKVSKKGYKTLKKTYKVK
ncbi:MAG: hypothetical protein E7263_08220 [Lachnospiraceae bacterium]|nr:hypothetical protein [Lachnospiraceae bacterium]